VALSAVRMRSGKWIWPRCGRVRRWVGPTWSVIDCCTREILGWNLSQHCRIEDALAAVLGHCQCVFGLATPIMPKTVAKLQRGALHLFRLKTRTNKSCF
jgi:hypothetical protein